MQLKSNCSTRDAYRAFPLEGVTVNALIIGGERSDSQLVAWFAEEVLRGEGAFWMHVEDFAAYEEAMRLKLLRELEIPVVGKATGGGPPAAVQ